MYYDKDGSPLEMMDWAIKFDQPEYKRIAETSLPDGKWISTVWLGLDHSFGGGPALIFQTMVFSSKDSFTELDTIRYSRLEEAKEGHKEAVARFSTL